MLWILKFLIVIVGFLFTPYMHAQKILDYSIKEEKPIPYREVAIIVNKDGYFPKKITAFLGERLRVFLTSSSAKSSCMVLNSHPLFLAAHPGKIAEGVIDLNKAGEFYFHCPSASYWGKLTVIDNDAVKRAQRSIASENQGPWVPRDY